MKVTVFRKVANAKDGRKFDAYSTKLTKKDGSEVYCNIKFKKSCTIPSEFPVNILVDKSAANLASVKATTADGEDYTRFTLWIDAYTLDSEKYVDHSLDDFD